MNGKLHSLFSELFSRPELRDDPPVLVDIGASGAVHGAWKDIAKYSICIAFDPDARETNFVSAAAKDYRQLIFVPAIVTAQDVTEVNFHLTASPYCSSTLKPDQAHLSQWAFAPLFQIEKTIQLPSVTLSHVIQKHQLKHIDWFKVDSQGTDLRLFESIGSSLVSKVIAADFEPGIMDAYMGEDKLFSILESLKKYGFWISTLKVMGSRRIPHHVLESLPPRDRYYIDRTLPACPGWGEVTVLNELEKTSEVTTREWLLSWIFSTLQNHHGFALHQALRAHASTHDELFVRLANNSKSFLHISWWKQPFHYLISLAHLIRRIVFPS